MGAKTLKLKEDSYFNMAVSTYVGSPLRKRTFEIASQRERAARSRWWRCVAGTLSFILT